jgi:hypothetical protein
MVQDEGARERLLKELGIEIEAKTNLGYIIPDGLNLLDRKKILNHIKQHKDFSTNNILTKTQGGKGTQSINFEFMSNFGGPVTVIDSISGNAPNCTITVHGSSSLFSNISKLKILGSSDVYLATVSLSNNIITTTAINNSSGTSVTGPTCVSLFPTGAVVTSKGYKYSLRYNYSGINSTLSFNNLTTGESLFQISPTTSNYSIPFMVVQFMREYKDGTGNIVHKWVSGHTTLPASDVAQIKAVRIGFVLVSNTAKIKGAKGVVSKTIDFCPFENYCYTLSDLNKVAYVFRTTIHLRNFDYLKRIDDKVL